MRALLVYRSLMLTRTAKFLVSAQNFHFGSISNSISKNTLGLISQNELLSVVNSKTVSFVQFKVVGL